MLVFEMHYSFVAGEEKKEERGYNQLFRLDKGDEDNEIEAIKAAIRHFRDRLWHFQNIFPDDNLRLGCLKVGRYQIPAIDEHGCCEFGRCGTPFFEWKNADPFHESKSLDRKLANFIKSRERHS